MGSDIDLWPDPRLSNQRPAWLTDDQQWRDQFHAMDLDNCRWIEKHWDMAGGKAPAVDTLWVTTEKIGGGDTVLWLVSLLVVIGLVAWVAAVALFGGGR